MMPEPSATNSLPPDLVGFVPTLADALAGLHDDQHLVISILNSDRYLQFADFGPNLRGETVGNSYLSGSDVLNVSELAWLAAHGWEEPDEAGNHWRHWGPIDPLVAATVTVVTLHQIHGVTDCDQLSFQSEIPAVMNILLEAG